MTTREEVAKKLPNWTSFYEEDCRNVFVLFIT